MLRSLQIALLAALFIVVMVIPGSHAAASDGTPVLAAQTQAQDGPNPYAGTDGASPLDEVPVVPMVGGTVGLLGLLVLVAVRRGWI